LAVLAAALPVGLAGEAAVGPGVEPEEAAAEPVWAAPAAVQLALAG